MTTTSQTLADHPGEHNARRLARIEQCSARKDLIGAIEAQFIPILRADGTVSTAFSGTMAFPHKREVYAINQRLAAEYAAKHGLANWAAMQATGYDAFLAYDAAAAQKVAA